MSAVAAPEVTRFLSEHPPFDALRPADLERVAAAAEVEFFEAGTTIFSQGAEPVEHLRVIRSGAVEVVSDGRVLDLLGPGELFGQASMLSGMPPGFETRAAEDTLCYRIPAAIATTPLSGPAGLRYVARSLLKLPAAEVATAAPEAADPATQPVGALIRERPVICLPTSTIREAAELMTTAHATCAVVDLGDGGLGILTDHDLRTRVVAGGLGGDAPVSAGMSAPAHTCTPERLGGDVALEMLDRGLRHFPVVSSTGEVLGVLEDVDLVAAQMRSSFYLRQSIARATTADEVAAAARGLVPAVISMRDARVAAVNVMGTYAVFVDALTRRLLELALDEVDVPKAEFAWLALGSQARREAMPSSDVDSAIAWFGDREDEPLRTKLHLLGMKVVAGLSACGLHADEHGATASDLRFVRSLRSWQEVVRGLIADPSQEKAMILLSVLFDSRPVWGRHAGTPVADTFRLAPRNPQLLRLLGRFALVERPPTGFFRGLVVEHGGEHRGRLDLKRGGMIPIVALARWAGIAAGVTSTSTTERLRAAAEAGTLPAADAHSLTDAFALINELRLEHQVQQLRAGQTPDDFLDPQGLSELARSYLREAFRAVSAIQKRVAAELEVWGV